MPRGQVHELAVLHPNLILQTLQEVADEQGLEFNSVPQNLAEVGDWKQILVRLVGKDFRADFDVQQMPGCCAVLILSYLHCMPETQDIFDQVVQLVEDATFRAGYGSLMMAQVVPAYTRSTWKDQPWIECLAFHRGWTVSDPFRNAKSGNLVVYLTKDMKHKAKVAGFEFREERSV
jgi:hypothetical protein